MRHRLDHPAARRAGAARAAERALVAARDLEVTMQWSPAEDQELSIAVESMWTEGRSLEDTLSAVMAEVPGRSLRSIADRWAAMSRADGLWCPEPSDLDVAIRAVRRRTTPPSPGRTRSPSPVAPVAAPPSPLLLLPIDLWQHVFSTLDGRGVSCAARASRALYGLAKPRLDALAVADVVGRLVDVVEWYGLAKPGLHELETARIVDALESGWWPPRQGMHPDSDSEDDEYDRWYGQDLWDRDPDGDCINCGAAGVAGGKCYSCGAPVEPWDGSFHYDSGWVDRWPPWGPATTTTAAAAGGGAVAPAASPYRSLAARVFHPHLTDAACLSRAARTSRAWRVLTKPRLDELEVAYVVARLVDVVAGPPRPGPLSDSDSDDDYDMWYGQDLVGEPDGECIGCGVVGVAGGKCLSCGAPVEPWDGSFHYDFGWVDGPRADEPE